MESPSRILEAVKFVEVGAGLHPGGHLETVCDAARFPTLLYQDCDDCEGTGEDYTDITPDGPWVCPRCDGSGEVPTEEAVEIVARGIAERDAGPLTEREWVRVVGGKVMANDYRFNARSVLMALRTIGDEG